MKQRVHLKGTHPCIICATHLLSGVYIVYARILCEKVLNIIMCNRVSGVDRRENM